MFLASDITTQLGLIFFNMKTTLVTGRGSYRVGEAGGEGGGEEESETMEGDRCAQRYQRQHLFWSFGGCFPVQSLRLAGPPSV